MEKEKIAYEKGYRTVNGITFGLTNNILSTWINKKGYYTFAIMTGSRTDGTRKKHNVLVHRLVAYQKYGNDIYNKGIEVRHFDGDSLNNCDNNILIGTHSENMMDIPEEERVKKAIKASLEVRVLTDEEIEKVRADRIKGFTFQELADKYNLSGKGHAHYIVNNKYVTKK